MNNRPQRIIIAGSRSIEDADLEVDAAMSQITAGGGNRGRYEIVSGGARGVDKAGERWAEEYDCDVACFDPYNKENTLTEHSYYEEGKVAFLKRNGEMAEYADMLVAIWDGESNGTRDMIDKALDGGLDVYVYVVN